jgi:hypothetical protein
LKWYAYNIDRIEYNRKNEIVILRHVVLSTSLFYFGILTIDRLKQSKTVFTLDLFDGRLLQGILKFIQGLEEIIDSTYKRVNSGSVSGAPKVCNLGGLLPHVRPY